MDNGSTIPLPPGRHMTDDAAMPSHFKTAHDLSMWIHDHSDGTRDAQGKPMYGGLARAVNWFLYHGIKVDDLQGFNPAGVDPQTLYGRYGPVVPGGQVRVVGSAPTGNSEHEQLLSHSTSGADASAQAASDATNRLLSIVPNRQHENQTGSADSGGDQPSDPSPVTAGDAAINFGETGGYGNQPHRYAAMDYAARAKMNANPQNPTEILQQVTDLLNHGHSSLACKLAATTGYMGTDNVIGLLNNGSHHKAVEWAHQYKFKKGPVPEWNPSEPFQPLDPVHAFAAEYRIVGKHQKDDVPYPVGVKLSDVNAVLQQMAQNNGDDSFHPYGDWVDKDNTVHLSDGRKITLDELKANNGAPPIDGQGTASDQTNQLPSVATSPNIQPGDKHNREKPTDLLGLNLDPTDKNK